MKIRDIITFDGGYDNVGKIWIASHKCDVCGHTKKCIAIDASEEEFRPGHICKDCVTKYLD